MPDFLWFVVKLYFELNNELLTPTRQLALSLKMSTGHFFNALSPIRGLGGLMRNAFAAQYPGEGEYDDF